MGISRVIEQLLGFSCLTPSKVTPLCHGDAYRGLRHVISPCIEVLDWVADASPTRRVDCSTSRPLKLFDVLPHEIVVCLLCAPEGGEWIQQHPIGYARKQLPGKHRHFYEIVAGFCFYREPLKCRVPKKRWPGERTQVLDFYRDGLVDAAFSCPREVENGE